MTAGQGRRPISLFGQGKLFRLESLIKAQAATPLWAAKALSPKALKTGAGEGIRTLDPNLGKSQSDVLLFIYKGLFCGFKSEHDPKMPKITLIMP